MESWLSKIKSLLDKIKFLLVKFCAGLLLAVANPAEQEFKLVEQEFYLAEQAFNLARQFLNLAQQAFWSLLRFVRLPTTTLVPRSSILVNCTSSQQHNSVCFSCLHLPDENPVEQPFQKNLVFVATEITVM